MNMFVAFATILILFISYSESHTPGTVTADSSTFDKLLEKFDVVLVNFDDKFPLAEKHDEFKRFAANFGATKNLLLIEIQIEDHDEKDTRALAKKYGVRKENYPVYKLFTKGKSKPIDYTGDKSEQDLKRFLSQNTNLWFGLAGTSEELDRVAGEFFHAASNKDEANIKLLLDKVREKAKGLADKKEKKSAEAYAKIMELVGKHGIEFVQREISRVQNLLKGKISNEKKQELQHRSNILLSFKPLKQTTADTVKTTHESGINAGEAAAATKNSDTDL